MVWGTQNYQWGSFLCRVGIIIEKNNIQHNRCILPCTLTTYAEILSLYRRSIMWLSRRGINISTFISLNMQYTWNLYSYYRFYFSIERLILYHKLSYQIMSWFLSNGNNISIILKYSPVSIRILRSATYLSSFNKTDMMVSLIIIYNRFCVTIISYINILTYTKFVIYRY